ncbi:MAG: tetratricopeptide repeat protein [Eubacteriaceae bacterium]|nr:tetratricopeptide repeat protein [Eubacteriaceae bacterium]
MKDPYESLDRVKYAQSLGNIAELYIQAEIWDSALPIVEEQRRVFERAFGLAHPSTIEACTMLAEIYRKKEMPKMALKAEHSVYEGSLALLGGGHVDVANSCIRLMEGYLSIGEQKQAVSFALQAFQIIKLNSASDDAKIPEMVQKIIDMYFTVGEGKSTEEKQFGYELKAYQNHGIKTKARFAPPLKKPYASEKAFGHETWKLAVMSPSTDDILSYRLTESQYAAAKIACKGANAEQIAYELGITEQNAQRALSNAVARINALISASCITPKGKPAIEAPGSAWLEVIKNHKAAAYLDNILSYNEMEAIALLAEERSIEEIASFFSINLHQAQMLTESIRKTVSCYIAEGSLSEFLAFKSSLKAHRRIARKRCQAEMPANDPMKSRIARKSKRQK